MTHDEKVLALLADGQPHTHHEIYALHVIGHSRIASLRRKGHEIRTWRDGDQYMHQLVSPLDEPPAQNVTESGPDSSGLSANASGSSSGDAVPRTGAGRVNAVPARQLALLVPACVITVLCGEAWGTLTGLIA